MWPLNSFVCKMKVLSVEGNYIERVYLSFNVLHLCENWKRKHWFPKCDGQPHPKPSIIGGLATNVIPQPLPHIPQVGIYEVKEVCHLAHCQVVEQCLSVWRKHPHAVVSAPRAGRHMSWVCTLQLRWAMLTFAFPEIELASSASTGGFALCSWAWYHPLWVLSSGQCFLC